MDRGYMAPQVWACRGPLPFSQPLFEAGRADYTYSNGNRTIQKNALSQSSIVAGAAKSSGKWYIEFVMASAGSTGDANDWQFGMATAGDNSNYLGNYASSLGMQNASSYSNGFTGIGSITVNATVPHPAAVIGLAYDADAKKFWVGIDGAYVSSGDPVAGTNPNASGWSNTLALFPALRAYNNSAVTMTIPTSWTYQPAGFSSWA